MPRPAAITVWIGCQTLVLLAAAAGVRLWSRQPGPPESLALSELVGVQIVAAALLFPVVLADGRTLVVNLSLIVPMQQLAGLLSAVPQAVVLRSTAFVAVWVVGLAGWARTARTDRARTAAVVAATLLSVGGALIWYDRAEAAAESAAELPDPLRYGPLMSGVTGATTASAEWGIVGWAADLVPLAGLALSGGWRATHSRPA